VSAVEVCRSEDGPRGGLSWVVLVDGQRVGSSRTKRGAKQIAKAHRPKAEAAFFEPRFAGIVEEIVEEKAPVLLEWSNGFAYVRPGGAAVVSLTLGAKRIA
jgi:hypothetical protein